MKIKVSEIFYSAQGEGRFVGVPSVFLRTFGCNFTCSGFGMPRGTPSNEADEVAKTVQLYMRYEDLPLVNTGCDSYASWHPKFKHLSPTYETTEVVDRMLALTPNNKWVQNNSNDVHLVITGGEPLLGWQRSYEELLDNERMQGLKNLTFETNGTQELHADFRHYLLDWTLSPMRGKRGHNALTFSVSAKLSASGERWEDAIKPDIVCSYENIGHTYLKFVVEKPSDFDEVDQAVSEYRQAGFKGLIYVMPVGGVIEMYHANMTAVANECMKRGYYFSPRLHTSLWGNAWGK